MDKLIVAGHSFGGVSAIGVATTDNAGIDGLSSLGCAAIVADVVPGHVVSTPALHHHMCCIAAAVLAGCAFAAPVTTPSSAEAWAVAASALLHSPISCVGDC